MESLVDDEDHNDQLSENNLEVIQNFASHRLMNQVHGALKKQYLETNERLRLDLTVKKDDLKRLTNERESHGVKLYSLQQQLARIQHDLEITNNEYLGLLDSRVQVDEVVKELSAQNDEKKLLLNEYTKQEVKYNKELSSLNEAIRQIEKYNEEIKAEIALNRRQAYKGEQAIQELEKIKENQDVYTDNLTKQIKHITQQIQVYKDQISIQEEESKDSNYLLSETTKELELLANEKKTVLSHLNSSLAHLRRRDEALGQANETLVNAQTAVHDYDVEIDGVKRNLQKEQEKHESLVNMRDRLESDVKWVEESLQKLKSEKDSLQDRYSLLQKSLTQTDSDTKKLELINKQLRIESETLLQNIQVVIRERQQLEADIQLNLSTKSNISKAVQNIMQEQSKLIQRNHKLENELHDIENEIAKTKIDTLNEKNSSDHVKTQYNNNQKDLQEKESLVAKYQLEVRQRNDEIEKKMYRVDRLNRKYNKLVERVGENGEDNLGPLEITIKVLNKEISGLQQECNDLERDWLKYQTDQVNIACDKDVISEENVELQARVTILTQQQLRLSKELSTLKNGVKNTTNNYNDLQKDMIKLNNLISENEIKTDKLNKTTSEFERECIEVLKELEKECVSLQTEVSKIKSQKGQLLDEIIDMERQASLWEKKIQLEKETKEALDPTVGQQEMKNMEREIRRMTLRFDGLVKEQDRLSQEMVRAVLKRSDISNKYGGKSLHADNKSNKLSVAVSNGAVSLVNSSIVSNGNKQHVSMATIKKRLAVLKHDVRNLNQDIALKVVDIEQKTAEVSEITSELDRLTTNYSDLESNNRNIQVDINDLLFQKQLQQEQIFYKQKFCKRNKELVASDNKISQSIMIDRSFLLAKQDLESLQDILYSLSSVYPHLYEVLQRVIKMTNVDIEMSN